MWNYSDFELKKNIKGDWERFGFLIMKSEVTEPLIRAYSMANYPEEKGVVKFNIRIASHLLGSTGIPPGRCLLMFSI